MASIEYVVNATGNLSAFLEKAGLTADHLDSQLEDLSKRIATPEVDLKDTKFTLGMVNAAKRLDKLAAMVADPAVEVDTGKAQVEILRINTMLDRLDARHVTATVNVNTDRGVLSRIRGALPGGGGGAGGAVAGGGALASSAAGFAPGLAPLLSSPLAITGAITAALAALPFAATAAAGGIVTILGGGLAALGLYAERGRKGVQKAFRELGTDASSQLQRIAKPFGDTITSILRTADRTLPAIMKPLGAALNQIAGPLKTFSDTLIKSLASPSVAKAIRDLGGAFGAILKALAPSLPSIINQIADGIDGIASAIRAHPKIFADMINFLGHLVGWSLAAIGALTRVANWLVEFTRTAGHWLKVSFADFHGFFTAVHNSALAFIDAMVASFRAFWHNLTNIFDRLRRDIAATWNAIWVSTIGRVRNGINDLVGWFRTIPGRVLGALFGLGTQLYAKGHAVITDFWNGLKSVAGSVFSWVGNFAKNIWDKVKSFFRIGSPSGLFYDLGKNLMLGLLNGIKDHAHKAQQAAQEVSRRIADAGGGVQRWAPLVRRALSMEGLSQSLVGNVLYQMQTESGGNPNIQNNWDINAQRGTPSAGLMQVIGPTFGAYHWPGTSWNILDPLANIAAALNYARNVYGPSLMSGGMGIGSGHGYDSGGWLPVGTSIAVNKTGRPERVLGPGEGGTVININVAAGPGTNRRALAQELADLILYHTKTGGRLYPVGTAPR